MRGPILMSELFTFCNSQIIILFDIKINRKGDFLFANVLSVKQTKAKGLELDNNCKVYEELKRLTLLDFPETPLSFEQDGIYLKEVVPTTAIQAIE